MIKTININIKQNLIKILISNKSGADFYLLKNKKGAT